MKNNLLTAIAAAFLLSMPQVIHAQAPDLGTVSDYALFTAVGAISNDGLTEVTGNIGTNAGAVTGFPPGIFTGEMHIEDTITAQAKIDVISAYLQLSTLPCESGITATMGDGQIVMPGIYCTGAAASITGELFLDAGGDSDAVFIIQIDGAFSTGALAKVTLINSASVYNVYWQVNGAVAFAAGSEVRGTIIANGAIGLAVGSSIYGRGLSKVGAIALSSNIVELGTALIYYADTDGDGYGDIDNSISSVTMPAGYTMDNSDCDDAHVTVHPGAIELCDGLDNNCNLIVDEGLVSVAITPEGTAFTCKNTELSFSTEACTGCTYQWFKNDHAIVGATMNEYSTDKPAYYSLQVTMPGGCFAVSEHTLLHVDTYPNANIKAPNGLNICAPASGKNIVLKVNYLESNTYQWYLNSFLYTGAGANSYRIYPEETGHFYCVVTNPAGCSSTSPQCNVINSCRSVLAMETAHLNIYPNPSTGDFTIALNNFGLSGNVSVEIMNAMGQVIYTQIVSSENGDLNDNIHLEGMTSGIYFVKVISNGDQFISQLMIE